MALTKIDDRGLKTPIDLLDNEKIRFGTGNDLEIHHTGTNTFIENSTGPLKIRSDTLELSASNAEQMLYGTANAGVNLYYDSAKKFETTSSGVTVTGNVNLAADNNSFTVGAGSDLQIYHDGTNNILRNVGTRLDVIVNSSETAAVFNPNTSVELYYDNSKKLNTESFGVDVNGKLRADEVQVADTHKIHIGTHDDLQLYHDGSHSYINNTTGELRIRAKDGENSIVAYRDGSVRLYHDNSKKLETTSTGIRIFPGGSTATVNASTETSGDTFVLRLNKDGTDATTFKLKAQDSGGGLVDRFEISSSGTFKIKRSGDTSFHISDTSANAVSAWIQARTAGHVEYNCYKEGVGTKYPHVFVGYTEEYARIDTNGIKFNGDTAAANALDDYERGSWTMGFEYYNTTTSAWTTVPFDNSPDYTSFDYVKCGHLVHVWGYTGGFNVGSAAVNKGARLTGLPYSAVSAAPYYGASCIFTHTSAFGDSSGNIEYVATGYTPYNFAGLYPIRPATDSGACWMDGNKTFMFSATYETAS